MKQDMQAEFLAGLWGKLAESGLPKDLQKKIYDGARDECEAYALKEGREARYESILLAMEVLKPEVTRSFPLGCQGLARYLAEAGERLPLQNIDMTMYAAATVLGYDASQAGRFHSCVKALVEAGILQREVVFEDGDESLELDPEEVADHVLRSENRLPMINPMSGEISSHIEDQFITTYRLGKDFLAVL